MFLARPRCRKRGLRFAGGYLWDGETGGGIVSVYRCALCGARLRGNGGWSDATPHEWKMATGRVGTSSIQVHSPRGPLTAETAECSLMVAWDSFCEVVVVYEPNTRLFWWSYERVKFGAPTGIFQRLRDSTVLYLASGKLVSFAIVPSSGLAVRESTEHAKSLHAALDRAVKSVQESRDVIDRGGLSSGFTVVDLSSLGLEFLMPPGSAATTDLPRIVSVAFASGRWEVVMEGQSRDQVIVTLDESYRLPGQSRRRQ